MILNVPDLYLTILIIDNRFMKLSQCFNNRLIPSVSFCFNRNIMKCNADLTKSSGRMKAINIYFYRPSIGGEKKDFHLLLLHLIPLLY